MKEFDLQVFDRNIKLITNWCGNAYDFFELANETDLTAIVMQGHSSSPWYDEKKRLLVVSYKHLGGHYLRQLLCVTMGFESERFDAVHGSGLVYKNQGIIFIGSHAAGKSTCANMFEAEVLDDDLMVIDRSNIYVTGKCGAITIEENGQKTLDYNFSKDATKKHNLDSVFLLDKKKPGGYAKQVENKIPRTFACVDAIDPYFTKVYCSQPAIEVEANVYQLGTKNDPDKTKGAINEILENI